MYHTDHIPIVTHESSHNWGDKRPQQFVGARLVTHRSRTTYSTFVWERLVTLHEIPNTTRPTVIHARLPLSVQQALHTQSSTNIMVGLPRVCRMLTLVTKLPKCLCEIDETKYGIVEFNQ
mmetsp:Transcript_27954/g.45379  ORF Transcript_27954/g.45379 Transcript_27954/m.45379 type:complete len:120 (-) Transcript_27954:75-434(-)